MGYTVTYRQRRVIEQEIDRQEALLRILKGMGVHAGIDRRKGTTIQCQMVEATIRNLWEVLSVDQNSAA